MKKLVIETLLSLATGALLLYAAVNSFKSLGDERQPTVEAVQASHPRDAGIHCGTCFALARRED
jgi:hypothetical protein